MPDRFSEFVLMIDKNSDGSISSDEYILSAKRAINYSAISSKATGVPEGIVAIHLSPSDAKARFAAFKTRAQPILSGCIEEPTEEQFQQLAAFHRAAADDVAEFMAGRSRQSEWQIHAMKLGMELEFGAEYAASKIVESVDALSPFTDRSPSCPTSGRPQRKTKSANLDK